MAVEGQVMVFFKHKRLQKQKEKLEYSFNPISISSIILMIY